MRRGARNLRVLVVDDDDDLREAMGEVLRHEGHEVDEARSGRDALDRLAVGHLPDVIVLDLMMPEMDGWEFRSRQRAEPALAHLPVLVVSAVDPYPLVNEHRLPKPFRAADLTRMVARLAAARDGEPRAAP